VLDISGVQCDSDRVSILAAAVSHIEKLTSMVQGGPSAPPGPPEEAAQESGFPLFFDDNDIADFSDGNVVATSSSTLEDPLQLQDSSLMFFEAPIPMAIMELGGNFLTCNRAFNSMAGFAQGQIKNMTVLDLTCQAEVAALYATMNALLISKERAPVMTMQKSCQFPKGRYNANVSMSLVRDEQGQNKYVTLIPHRNVWAGLVNVYCACLNIELRTSYTLKPRTCTLLATPTQPPSGVILVVSSC
jgi:PAS domain S-box-containing protein